MRNQNIFRLLLIVLILFLITLRFLLILKNILNLGNLVDLWILIFFRLIIYLFFILQSKVLLILKLIIILMTFIIIKLIFFFLINQRNFSYVHFAFSFSIFIFNLIITIIINRFLLLIFFFFFVYVSFNFLYFLIWLSQLHYFIFEILNFLYFCIFVSFLDFRYFLNSFDLAFLFAVIIWFWLLTNWQSINTMTIALRRWIVFIFRGSSCCSLFSQFHHVNSFQFTNIIDARLSFLEFKLLFQNFSIVYCALILLYLSWEFPINYQGLLNVSTDCLGVQVSEIESWESFHLVWVLWNKSFVSNINISRSIFNVLMGFVLFIFFHFLNLNFKYLY